MKRISNQPLLFAVVLATVFVGPRAVSHSGDRLAGKSDWPMFGGTPQRNMVNLVDRNVPTDWSIEAGKYKNVKWIADLGDHAYCGPVVANGAVYVGAGAKPGDPNAKGDWAVLMAFDEASGKFLWKIAHKYPERPFLVMFRISGLPSTPIVEGDGIFYVTPAGQVVRASTAGKVVWTYDMTKELNVYTFRSMCAPLIVGDLLMIVTGNGINDRGALPAPQAPSFIALNKKTGQLTWQSALPGGNIIEMQWANPALAMVAGKPQVIFPGGDGVLYGLEPETGKVIWKCDCHPVRPKRGEAANYFIATPVVVGEKLYIGMGVAPEQGTSPRSSYFLCIDLTKSGDVSPKSLDPKDPANEGSALVWSFGGPIVPRPKKGRSVYFGPTVSTCALHDGLVYVVEESGFLYCLDAKTGERYWFDDLKTAVWSSPYYVDGKVFVGAQDGTTFIYSHGKAKKLLNQIDHFETIDGTPVVANGVLYITTRSKLIAIAERK
jgi:outer membrane protein assembly factor BamB